MAKASIKLIGIYRSIAGLHNLQEIRLLVCPLLYSGMRILITSIAFTASILLAFDSSNAPKPNLYKSQISGLSIRFPGEPESEVTRQTEGEIEMAGFDDGKMEYTLELRKATDPGIMEKELAKFGTMYDASKKMVANFHGNKQGYTEGLKRADWKVKKHKGQMITFKAVRYDYHFRAIVLEDMVITLTVKARSNPMGKSDYDDKAALKFANSLKLK